MSCCQFNRNLIAAFRETLASFNHLLENIDAANELLHTIHEHQEGFHIVYRQSCPICQACRRSGLDEVDGDAS